jgi:TonB family protein
MNRWHRHEALQGRMGASQGRVPSAQGVRRVAEAQDAHRAIRTEERRRRLVGLALTAAVALLAHAAVLLPAFALWLAASPDDLQRSRVQMVAMSSAQWEKNRKLDLEYPEREEPEAQADQEREKPEDPEDEVPNGQVVSLPTPEQQEVPDHADYVAADNHRAERETRSRYQSQHYKNPTFKPQMGADEPMEVPASDRVETQTAMGPDAVMGGPQGPGRALDGTVGADRENGGGGQRMAFDLPRRSAREKLQLHEAAGGTYENRERVDELQSDTDRLEVAMGTHQDEASRTGPGKGEGNGQGMIGGAGTDGLPTLAQLTPSLVDIERIAGMPANDALDEVETDAETRLNAWRWKHATFIDRIKKGVNRTWRGAQVFNRMDPTRQVYGSQDLTTWLSVTIDREGNVTEINVLEQSGADFLDDEAIRSMRAAAPFTNPPDGIFKNGDTFTFRFGFQIRNQWGHMDLDWKPY